jgi:hypothetical protein
MTPAEFGKLVAEETEKWGKVPAPPMKWEHYPNLRRRPPTPSKNRGPVQVRIRRAFLASGAED